MASRFARFDTTAWPLVTVTFEGTPTDEAFEACLADFDAVYAKGARVAFVLDTSDAGPLSATQRRRAASWMAARTRMLRDQCLGLAFVVASQVIRGVITAVFWIQPMPAAWTIEMRRASAVAWARERLREARVDRSEERISEI